MLLFFCFLITVYGQYGPVSCTKDRFCNVVSDSKNYVTCSIPVNMTIGTCRCLTEKGFDGNATSSNPCTCNSPKDVYKESPGIFYCAVLSEAVQYNQQAARNIKMKASLDLYNYYFIWPNNEYAINQFFNGNTTPIDQFMRSDVMFQSGPYGAFNDQRGAIEVSYGVTAAIGTIQVFGMDVRKVLYTGNQLWAVVYLQFGVYDSYPPTTPFYVYNVSNPGIYTFDDDFKISKISSYAWYLDVVSDTPKSMEGLEATCDIIMANCNSTNDPEGYYANFTDCVSFLDEIEYGTYANLRSNTYSCRSFHGWLTIRDPERHCPHSGKGGGGYCVLSGWESNFFPEYFRKRNDEQLILPANDPAVLSHYEKVFYNTYMANKPDHTHPFFMHNEL